MASLTFEQVLYRAATSRGIEPGFWDIWGHYHATGPEAKQAILRAMGLAADSSEELNRSLAAETRREWGRLLAPVIVTGESDAVELALSPRNPWENAPAFRYSGRMAARRRVFPACGRLAVE